MSKSKEATESKQVYNFKLIISIKGNFTFLEADIGAIESFKELDGARNTERSRTTKNRMHPAVGFLI